MIRNLCFIWSACFAFLAMRLFLHGIITAPLEISFLPGSVAALAAAYCFWLIGMGERGPVR